MTVLSPDSDVDRAITQHALSQPSPAQAFGSDLFVGDGLGERENSAAVVLHCAEEVDVFASGSAEAGVEARVPRGCPRRAGHECVSGSCPGCDFARTQGST